MLRKLLPIFHTKIAYSWTEWASSTAQETHCATLAIKVYKRYKIKIARKWSTKSMSYSYYIPMQRLWLHHACCEIQSFNLFPIFRALNSIFKFLVIKVELLKISVVFLSIFPNKRAGTLINFQGNLQPAYLFFFIFLVKNFCKKYSNLL